MTCYLQPSASPIALMVSPHLSSLLTSPLNTVLVVPGQVACDHHAAVYAVLCGGLCTLISDPGSVSQSPKKKKSL